MNPEILAQKKKIIESPKHSPTRAEDIKLLKMLQYHAGSIGGGSPTQKTSVNETKSIAEIQEEITLLRNKTEKLVPAEADVKVLNDRSVVDVASLPGLPTYLKVYL
jgi:hypothetical protein